MFGFFRKKEDKTEINNLKQAVQTGFNNVKHDINNLTKWIKHLDAQDVQVKNDLIDVSEDISSIKEEIENLKNMISILGNAQSFKQRRTVFDKQTVDYPVLDSVQTDVQTAILDNLTANERAIIFMLLNSDMKLSYEDLAAMLGKNKSTIRGQVNSIKQKSEGLIEESMGENNKKRVYIPEKTKEILLKSRKVRDKSKKKEKNYEN